MAPGRADPLAPSELSRSRGGPEPRAPVYAITS
jgi:hypothetical protein